MQNIYKELIIDTKLTDDHSSKFLQLSNEQVLKDIFFSRKDYEVFYVQMSNEYHLQEGGADKQYNFFFESVRMAYQYHIPLILSPEILWVAIIQGFSIHINENSEHFRAKIVDFDGKKKLVVQRDETDLRKLDWDNIFTDFTDLIRDNIGTTLHSNLIQKFSTSTRLTQTVQEIQMMDTFQNYFEYVLVCGCGLPKVKLMGTLDDWIKLKEATLKLKEFELDWWIDKLVPILDKLISEYQANQPDIVFWNDIFHYRQGGASFGPSLANGWATLFFPYLEVQQGYGGQGQFKYIKQEFVYGKAFNPDGYKKGEMALYPNQIPSGISQAPILYINLLTGEQFDLTASSGFLKIIKNKDGYLQPELGWFVRKGTKISKTNR